MEESYTKQIQRRKKLLLSLSDKGSNEPKLVTEIKKAKIDLTQRNTGKKCLFWRGPTFKQARIREEIVLAISMLNKGFDIEFVLCAGSMTACGYKNIIDDKQNINCFNNNWLDDCSICVSTGKKCMKAMNAKYIYMEELVGVGKMAELKLLSDTISIEDILSYESDNVNIGTIVSSSFNRYCMSFKNSEEIKISDTFFNKILREYFYSCLVCLEAGKKTISIKKPDYIIMQHSCYSAWGPMFQYATSMEIPTLTWSGGHVLNQTIFRLSNFDDIGGPAFPQKDRWIKIKNNTLSHIEYKKLSSYMMESIKKCRYGNNENISKKLKNKLTKHNKPLWLIPTQLNWDWDGQIYKYPHYFLNSIDWLKNTLSIIKDVDTVVWLLKPYPFESKKELVLRSTNSICAEVLGTRKYPHIKILSPKINTYMIFPHLSGCATMCGSLGLEAAMFGIPVLGAAPWSAYYDIIGNQFETKEQYFNQLRNANKIPMLKQEQIKLIESFAYDYFIYKQIPFFKNCKIQPLNKIRKNKILDTVSNGIISFKTIGNDNNPLTRKIYSKDWKTFLTENK